MSILNFEWNYDDYLAVTNREDSHKNRVRWNNVIQLISNKHYEYVDEEIRNTITYVDKEVLEEEV